ncbi:septal ring lytic transglycosylase RlpA family protein [Pelagibius litoralis]|uniref:Endolytic peptidoglycan transglycosylase RlpA n=1 Tax=Pelagibius litoralis TaxID=374515 RepID=A0A967C7G0_9PROT|nr:septal ring lytic transglycosylase RlpA family protein [Pelagibius litoralis]NIA67747.1 septal ring lytic transglycosylase RlpA family protein [Pelagibius litoralis]
MVASSLRSGALLLCLLGILAGCAETELAVHNAKRLKTPTDSTPATSGTFKVGKPYQIKSIWYYPRVDYSYDETGVASWYGPGFHGKRTANGEIYNQEDLTAAHRTLPMPTLVQVTNLENGRSIRVRINDRGPFAHGRIIDLSKRGAELLGFVRQGTAKVRVQILEPESRQLVNAAKGLGPGADAPPAVPVETVAVQQLPPVGQAAPAAPAGQPVQTAAAQSQLNDARAAQILSNPEPVVMQQAVRRTRLYVQAGAFTQIANAERMRARLSGLGNVQIARAVVGDTRFFRVRVGPMANVKEADKTLDLLLYNGITNAKVIVD